MANAIATQTLNDGQVNTIIKVTIVGDGSGEETATVIFDASAYSTASTSNKLWKLQYATIGCSAYLAWDATTDVLLYPLLADHSDCVSFDEFGGIINNAGAGKTGDIVITTTGLGSGDIITMILYVKER